MLFSKIWPILFFLALFVGGIHFVKFCISRWKL